MYNVLWQIEETRLRGLSYLYLGYWIAECRKMAYKTIYRPLERLDHGRWVKCAPPDYAATESPPTRAIACAPCWSDNSRFHYKDLRSLADCAVTHADFMPAVTLPLAVWPVAPMLDWTDRHYRYFARHITRHTWLYTEMVTTGALIHGDIPRHLRFDPMESPIALQLGGSEPADLAHCANSRENWGYDEVNLNVGCPSERVQRGAWRLPDERNRAGGRLRESHARRGEHPGDGQAPHWRRSDRALWLSGRVC